MSIRIRFTIVIGILSLIACVILAYASYTFSMKNAMAEAKTQGAMVFNMIDSRTCKLILHFNRIPGRHVAIISTSHTTVSAISVNVSPAYSTLNAMQRCQVVINGHAMAFIIVVRHLSVHLII